jgi:hypothetical protein
LLTEKKVQFIELKNDYDSIKKKYSENLIRNLKKAEKNLHIEKNINAGTVINSFRQAQGKILKEFRKENYQQLLHLMKQLESRNMLQTIGAYNAQGKLCASASFMKNHGRIIYLKGGATEEGKQKGAMHIIMDSVIKENAGADFIFDFGGSSVESVARFNKNFGAKEYVYLHLKKNNLPKAIGWMKKQYGEYTG